MDKNETEEFNRSSSQIINSTFVDNHQESKDRLFMPIWTNNLDFHKLFKLYSELKRAFIDTQRNLNYLTTKLTVKKLTKSELYELYLSVVESSPDTDLSFWFKIDLKYEK